jgi:hypothetical protein
VTDEHTLAREVLALKCPESSVAGAAEHASKGLDRSVAQVGPTRQTELRMASSSDAIRDAPARAWRAFKRLTQVSFPRSYPIIQFPNAPLILAFVSGLVAQNSRGHVHADAQAVSYLTMAVWAYLELFHGVNLFRRSLGLAYTISTAVHLANALHH